MVTERFNIPFALKFFRSFKVLIIWLIDRISKVEQTNNHKKG